MFSGIIEQTATVVAVRNEQQNKHFTLRAGFCRELKIDQSIAHNGVCLTVVDLTEDTYTVTAMKETLRRGPCLFQVLRIEKHRITRVKVTIKNEDNTQSDSERENG